MAIIPLDMNMNPILTLIFIESLVRIDDNPDLPTAGISDGLDQIGLDWTFQIDASSKCQSFSANNK